MKIAFVRGKYLNNFEGQNYLFDKKEIELTGISSLKPLHKNFLFTCIKLLSLADFQEIIGFDRLIKIISNRTLGDSHILFGLENLAKQFDIFHTADSHYYYSYQLAKLRAKGLIKKLIVTSWETIPYNNETVKRKKFIKRYTQKQADLFVCYTNKAKDCLIKERVDTKKINVVRIGVDLNRFKALPVSKSKTKTINILFVGRLVEEKGIMDLYKAYKKVKSQSASWRIKLKIIGEGKLEGKLRWLIKRDKLENAVSIEKKEYNEVAKVYQTADIFVLPSKRTKTWEEQYGMVLIEAMGSELPIIAYDSGAISEIVGEVGLLVKENNINALAKAIMKLVIDKKKRIKLGKMGRDRAEKCFDSRKTVKKIKGLYYKLSS